MFLERKIGLLHGTRFEELIFLFLLCLIKCNCSVQSPHIIFIVADDLGWNDVSFHGSKQIPTPNIDSLARDGVILNNYYVQPLCTPSRGSLMTGKYPIHLGLQHDVIYAGSPWGLSPDETILPQYLKQFNYVTHAVGKWHLGFFSKQYLPLRRGFDSFFGYWTGKEDLFTHFEELDTLSGLDLHDGNENAWNYMGYYSTELFTEKATNIIKSHNHSKPLFLYVAHQAVHTGNFYTPFQAPREYVEKFSHIKDIDRRKFAGMVSALDFSIGQIFMALEESNMLDNSIVVFTTDNGAAVQGIDLSTGSSWPLRGSKYTLWEGGVRAVGLVWSSQIRNQSRVSNEMMHISDWLPTLYSAVGGDIKILGKIDGYNLWPSICCNTPSPRQEILHNIDPEWHVESLRTRNYKLVKGSVMDGNFDGWFDKEGKKTDFPLPFTTQEQLMHEQVYDEFLKESRVANILQSKYGKTKDIFSYRLIKDKSEVKTEHCPNDLQNNNNYQSKVDTTCNNGNKENLNDDCQTYKSERCYEKQLKVDCGTRPENVTEDCKPQIAPCLFDIEKDPCEYSNLAVIMPEVVEELERLLDKYRLTAAPLRNQPVDPASNPKYHGYAWIPWKD